MNVADEMHIIGNFYQFAYLTICLAAYLGKFESESESESRAATNNKRKLKGVRECARAHTQPSKAQKQLFSLTVI